MDMFYKEKENQCQIQVEICVNGKRDRALVLFLHANLFTALS